MFASIDESQKKMGFDLHDAYSQPGTKNSKVIFHKIDISTLSKKVSIIIDEDIRTPGNYH
jgi:hypothetical protein